MINSDQDVENAKQLILDTLSDIKKFEDSKESRTLHVQVSITGILSRVHQKDSGFTLAQIRKHYGFSIDEFVKNFKIVKEEFGKGNVKIVNDFFNMYS